MEQTLYLECASGISGDMLVAALLDMGADENVLKEALGSLPINGFTIEISRVNKAGLDVCDFNVRLDEAHENHDHDMEYLYGHHHHNESEAHHHAHEHRGIEEIVNIIEASHIEKRAKDTAERIFQILAEAEAKAHGVSVQQVHFHEVGAVDSIVDIVAAAVCLDNLNITEVVIETICEGRGTVRCQHGILPVPVPAVVNIMEKYKLQMQITQAEGELITPTGAAIAAAIQTRTSMPERFTIAKVGMGAGKRNYERPSILRAMFIQEREAQEDAIWKLESNIDDSTGEALGYAMDRLMESGARDVYYTPVYMKKNRPAYLLSVICDKTQIPVMENVIFRETTTIGIRRTSMKRTVLEREKDTVLSRYGSFQVKRCVLPDGEIRIYPEYESAVKLAEENGLSFQDIMKEFQKMNFEVEKNDSNQ